MTLPYTPVADGENPVPTIDVVIPAYNEESSLPLVLSAIPSPPVRRVIVADNNSTDSTAELARDAGAIVVPAPRQGYGSACLSGLEYLRSHQPPEVVVFLDGDYSDHPEELPQVIEPILQGKAEMVIGSRTLGNRQRGALLPQARAGNLIACTLMRLLYGHRYTDLGPFRAITWKALERLEMNDPNFGWTAEMQVKALRRGIRVAEVPVSYRKRVGVSKITGTLKGTVMAGYKILYTVFRYALERPSAP
ncbi:MAG: glycosyltransferase family 2 protein [Acidobacteriota bacterium]